MKKLVKLFKNKPLTLATLCFVMLALFGEANVTYDGAMSIELKTFYDTLLLKNAEPRLLHNKWGQKQPIPANSGLSIEFRRPNVLPKVTAPIVEDVLPTGRKMGFTYVPATCSLYGDFIRWSQLLTLVAVDKLLVVGTKSLSSQSGRSLDSLTREILNSGTNVQYPVGITARHLLVGGENTYANNHYLSLKDLQRAALTLTNNLADGVADAGGMYVGIMHPDSHYQLTQDTIVQNLLHAQNADKFIENEIGELAGIRLFKSTEAKIFHAEDLSADARTLTVNSSTATVITVKETLTADDKKRLEGTSPYTTPRILLIDGFTYEVASVNYSAKTITIKTTNTDHNTAIVDWVGSTGEDVIDDMVIYPGEAGAKGRDIYSLLVIGAEDAYGVTEITGGGLEMIIKPPQDAMNLTSTQAWKATHTAEILCELYLVRVEHTTEYERGAN